MTGGAGFTRDGIERGRTNRSALKKKLPFQRLKENVFIKPVKNKLAIKKSTLEDLHAMKADRRNEEKLRRRFFLIFVLSILLIIFLWIGSWVA
ncbi:hypothetical protein AAOE16_02230 [Ekhidna sp. MALMAid0563]|uniref:hypothetical protein n=1 Tax=Ekhidna sp. MALMAid0563 TaxID=3143937 RepID=UPI0032DF4B71